MKRYSNGSGDILVPPPKMPPPTDRKAALYKKYKTLSLDGISGVGELLNDGDVYMHKHVPDVSQIP